MRKAALKRWGLLRRQKGKTPMLNQPAIVLKPWGREYLAYRNAEVAIWVLEINKGEATSLHCHPKKNTALIVLRGDVELSFIRDTFPHCLYGLDKINIFKGRFHRTRAASDGVVLLEVEAPDNKRDILRLEDDYGRAESPLEEATKPLDTTCLQIESDSFIKQFAGCSLQITGFNHYMFRDKNDIFVTLAGGLAHGLVPPGDAIDGATLLRFLKSFPSIPDSVFLQIWRSS